MRNHEIASPNAAELYFTDSLIGHVSTLLADALGGFPRRRRQPATRGPRPGVPAQRATAKAGAEPRGSWLDRLDAWFWRQEQRAREDYLAGSADIFELERRMRALERNPISRYY
jgi:hypothetical protein